MSLIGWRIELDGEELLTTFVRDFAIAVLTEYPGSVLVEIDEYGQSAKERAMAMTGDSLVALFSNLKKAS